jgi:hypothetical protein
VQELTDQALLDNFLACIISKDSAPAVSGEGNRKCAEDQELFLDFELSNGFMLSLECFPAYRTFHAQGGRYRMNEATLNLLETKIP